MNKIDTHQHLAFKSRFSYPWMESLPPLDKDCYGLEDYKAATKGSSIAGTVFMETDVAENDSPGEAGYVCKLASQSDSGIIGVIASGRPEKEGFPAYVEEIQHQKLVGLRRILHTEPDELSSQNRFRQNLKLLPEFGLTFDLCVLQKQLPVAIELIKACPETTFILDHCGVPDIAGNQAPFGDGWNFWKRQIESLASYPRVNCKISGILLYASESQRTPEGLRPYLETVIEAFGWDRVVWGGDWPVCTLAGTLLQWESLIEEILAGETQVNRNKLFTLNAGRLYNLEGE